MKFLNDFIRLCDNAYKKGWHEMNGGNLSYRMTDENVKELKSCKTLRKGEVVNLGISVPNLANQYFMVTGSGKFMMNMAVSPKDNLAVVKLDEKGESYTIVWGLESGGRPTMEFRAHLLAHSTKVKTDNDFRVIYHAHPNNLTALSFIYPYDDVIITKELWSIMPECSIVFPEGVGVVPFHIPGSMELADATCEKMLTYNIVLWAHHGVMVAGKTLEATFGLMEAVEKSGEILVKVNSMGGKKNEITAEDIKTMVKPFNLTIDKKFL